MSEHYDFHYQPTGSGAISGQQVLQQTEDAINELGDYVNDNVGGAMDVAQQALETAQNAEQDAQTALDTANSFSDAIQSAQQDASTALSTAQTAQTTATNANNTAIQAQQDASSAVTTANNASGQVSTLSGTVTALGQRVTTAEGNIGQNTSDITALTTRVGTAEGNITTLQNDVTIAQGNASSAMATAGQVKQQAFVFRYSSTALVASSTNSNTLLDNTDNLKVGDKVIDSSGVLFSITAIDTANSTFTIGTALIDLANDSDVVHKSGDETINGELTVNKLISNSIQSATGNIQIQSSGTNRSVSIYNGSSAGDGGGFWAYGKDSTNGSACRIQIYNTSKSRYERVDLVGSQFLPVPSGELDCGSTSNKWKSVYATNYYYGNDNVEFSTKFVTTDTNQTISGVKSFSDNISTKKIISNVAQLQINAKSSADSIAVIAGANASDGGGIWLYGKDNSNNSQVVLQVYDTANSTYHAARLNVDGSLTPTVSNNGLGSQSFKWVGFNGINPGALSLPSGNASDVIDIRSYLVNLDGTDNTYVAPANGWITINMNNCSGIHATITGLWSDSRIRASAGVVKFLMPVLKNQTVTLTIHGGTINNARFIPCQGNV